MQQETEEMGSRRLQVELKELRKKGVKNFIDLQVSESDISCWEGLVAPEKSPYNKGAFRVRIQFPKEYPFKPPTVGFLTQIHHPNVDRDGQVCLPEILPENWKPTHRVEAVIASLVRLVEEPELGHPLRPDLAYEYEKNKKKFFKEAEEHTKKFAEKRQ